MSQYDNNMTGIISKNDRKDSDKHPDVKGQCEINGVAYWISGWRKERKDGTGSFYSLRFEAKEAPKVETYKNGIRQSPKRDESDEVPF